MTVLLVFNLALLLLSAATFAGLMPARLSNGLVFLLHIIMGITTPTEKQARVLLIVWFISILVIVDGVALLMVYAF